MNHPIENYLLRIPRFGHNAQISVGSTLKTIMKNSSFILCGILFKLLKILHIGWKSKIRFLVLLHQEAPDKLRVSDWAYVCECERVGKMIEMERMRHTRIICQNCFIDFRRLLVSLLDDLVGHQFRRSGKDNFDKSFWFN